MFDVRVIGGGPAGCAAAIHLKRLGAQVRLYEKSHFPRQKLCGGFLSFESFADLEDLRVLEGLRQAGSVVLHRVVVASPRGSLLESPLSAPALSVSRSVLDSLLMAEARRVGVDIREGCAASIENPNEADITVVAAGRRWPWPNQPHTTPWYAWSTPTFGLQAMFESIDGVVDQVELDMVRDGYVGLARQAGGVNVCALVTQDCIRRWGPDLDHVIKQLASENPMLARHLSTARRISPWLSIGPVHLGIRRLVDGDTYFVGDAACVVDPFAGEGMSVALYSARLLAQAFQASARSPAVEYQRLWKNAFMPALRWHAGLRMLSALSFLHEPLWQLLNGIPGSVRRLTDLTRYRRAEAV